MNWLLIIVIAIIGLSGLAGYKKGLILTTFSLVSLILTLIITAKVNPQVSKGIQDKTNWDESIKAKVIQMFELKAQSNTDELKLVEQTNIIEKLPVPKLVKNSLIANNNKEAYKLLKITGFDEYIGNYLTQMIMNASSFVIVFIIVYIILTIMANALNIVSKLPVLNSLNKVSGFFVGLVQGLFRVWLMFIIITMLVGGSAIGQNAFEMINQNAFLGILYNNNYLMKVLLGLSQTLI